MEKSENIGELKSQLNNPEPDLEEGEEKPDEDGAGEEEGEGGEQFTMPDKFKDKSPEEIAKSYAELEKMIDKKAEEKALEIAQKKAEEDEPEEEEGEEEEETLPTEEGKPDFASMTPEQFAQWMDKKMDEKAKVEARKLEVKARKLIDDNQKMRMTIRTDVAEARKDHPLLKVNKEYTDLVVAIVEAASSKGESIGLKEACTKVDAVMVGKGKEEPGELEKKRLKQARAQVETGAGAAPGGGPETDAEKIKAGMLRGQKTGELGGLGF